MGPCPQWIAGRIRALAEAGIPRKEIAKRVQIRGIVPRLVLGPADRRVMFHQAALAKKSEYMIAHPPSRDPKTGKWIRTGVKCTE